MRPYFSGKFILEGLSVLQKAYKDKRGGVMRLIDADHLLAVAESEFNEDDMFKIRWLVHHLPTKYDVEKSCCGNREKKTHRP